MARFDIVVIESCGPGRVLGTFDEEGAARAYLEESGVAYLFAWGVAVRNNESDLFDFEGNGVFEPWPEQ